jgi:hypothetical protein
MLVLSATLFHVFQLMTVAVIRLITDIYNGNVYSCVGGYRFQTLEMS